MNMVMRKFIELNASARNGMKKFLTSERGDTNFISIIIVLVIVVFVAGMVWTLVNTYMPELMEKVTDFFDDLTS